MMRRPDYGTLIRTACEYANGCNRALETSFRFGHYKRYHWSQGTGELTFSDAGVPIVVARFQFVGSFSAISRTWMWSWANHSIDPARSREILRVRSYGRRFRMQKLTTPCWYAGAVDGWEMTALSAWLLRAKGVYRTRGGRSFSYMIITDMRWYLKEVCDDGGRGGSDGSAA